MRVLVTGGAGFIGSHTVDLLLARGYEVCVLDRLGPPVHRRGRPTYLPGDVEVLEGDVRSAGDLSRSLRGVDAIFHLAAYQDYMPDFSTFFDVNGVGTALLYELIVRDHLPVQKIVVASSQAVYGEGPYACPEHGRHLAAPRSPEQLARRDWEVRCPLSGVPTTPIPATEDLASPHNQYAISKYAQELIALRLGWRHRIPSVALRYSITQGPRQSFYNAYSGILRIFTMRLLHGRPPVVYEDGAQLRDYVAVEDAARANLLVLEDARADYQVLNVGGGGVATVLEYAALVARAVGTDLEPVVPGEYRVGDTRHIVSDVGKIRALGWAPQRSLPEIVEGYVAWARSQPDFGDYHREAEQAMKLVGAVQAT